MHGPDTIPWGYAAVKTAGDSIDLDALAAISDAERRESGEAESAWESSEPQPVLGRPSEEAADDWESSGAHLVPQALAEAAEPDWNALRAQAEAQASEQEQEVEPDWNALRAQAEEAQDSAEKATPAWRVHRPEAVTTAPASNDLSVEAEQKRVFERASHALELCAQAEAQLQEAERHYQQAESDEEAEVAAQRYEQAHAQLAYAQQLHEQTQQNTAEQTAPVQDYAAPALDYVTAAQEYMAPAQGNLTPAQNYVVPAQVAHYASAMPEAPLDPFAPVFASPSIAPAGAFAGAFAGAQPGVPGIGASAGWDAAESNGVARGSKWLPKLLAAAAVLAMGVGGVAFSQYRTAEAERAARTEKLLEEMHQADVARGSHGARSCREAG